MLRFTEPFIMTTITISISKFEKFDATFFFTRPFATIRNFNECVNPLSILDEAKITKKKTG